LAQDGKKASSLKKVIIIGGALLGGLVGWYYGGSSPGLTIIVGVLAGAWVGDMVWGFVED